MTAIPAPVLLVVGDHGRARCSGCCRDATTTERAHATALTGLEGELRTGCGATWTGVAADVASSELAFIAAMDTAAEMGLWYRGPVGWPEIGGAQ